MGPLHELLPERAAITRVMQIHGMPLGGGAVLAGLIIGCLGVVVWRQRQRLRHTQEQLRKLAVRVQVQQTLFDAHRNSQRVVDALEMVGHGMEAEGMLLLSLQNGWISHLFVWRRKTAAFRFLTKGTSLKKRFPSGYAALSRGQSILVWEGRQTQALSQPERELLKGWGMDRVIMTPILDGSETLRGVLCGVNFRGRGADCAYLEGVAHSFWMAMQNMESYQAMCHLGTRDLLTGMKNRNSYEQALSRYSELACDRFSCIYVDVNGLHELNNQQGHQQGDSMLCCVAQAMRDVFGEEHTYRIGGDEFVAFSTLPETEVTERIEVLRRCVAERGYHISVGGAGRKEGQRELEQLIRQAEDAMYQEKRAFYERNDRRGKPRSGLL